MEIFEKKSSEKQKILEKPFNSLNNLKKHNKNLMISKIINFIKKISLIFELT